LEFLMFNVMVLEVQLQIYSIDLLPEVASSSIVSIPTEAQTFRRCRFVGFDLFWIFRIFLVSQLDMVYTLMDVAMKNFMEL